MIRNVPGPVNRRIGIIQLARPQARLGGLGIIRDGSTAAARNIAGWTTLQNQTPDSAQNWISGQLVNQSTARLNTPGTLSYTPASATPGAPVAPWNSWLQPNCRSGSATSTTPATSSSLSGIGRIRGCADTGGNPIVVLAALLAGAASAVYLFRNFEGRF
jgi:hypothetical protein